MPVEGPRPRCQNPRCNAVLLKDSSSILCDSCQRKTVQPHDVAAESSGAEAASKSLEPEYYTVKELAEKLHYSEKQMRNFISRGILKGSRIRRKLLVSRKDYNNFVSQINNIPLELTSIDTNITEKALTAESEKHIEWTYEMVEELARRETDDGNHCFEELVNQLMKVCTEAHSRNDYVLYNKLLKRFSIQLKMKGRHRELSQICELDAFRRNADNVYPTLTYSQCKLVTFDIRKALDALNHWIENDQKLEKLSPLTRLHFFRTYSEILISATAYDLARKMLNIFLTSRSIEKVKFKSLCQALGVLGRAYLGSGEIDSALDIFEVILIEQNLTDDAEGIAVAEMNMGMAHMANGKYSFAERMFADAVERFRGRDNRATVWAELNLAIAMSKAGGSDHLDDIQGLVASALDYNIIHLECSRDYQANLEYLTSLRGFKTSTETRIRNEHSRVSRKINENNLSTDQLQSVNQAISVFALQYGYSGNVITSERSITTGGFKARSSIVRSFKKSLDIDNAVKYLERISHKANHFSIPFYNDFLVEVCKRRKDLIHAFVVQEIDTILKQTDSIKMFYAKFLESERLLEISEKILANIQNTETHEFLNLRANLYSCRGGKFFQIALDTYARSLDSTTIDHYKSKVYNNMAHLIYRHRKRSQYEKAIEYCKKSIELRTSVRFWYPQVLMLVLKIELANVGEIRGVVDEHRKTYGLRFHEIKEVSRMIYDKPKEKVFRVSCPKEII